MIRHNKMLIIPVFLIAVISAFLLLNCKGQNKQVTFDTVKVGKGSIAQTISATGTIEPIDEVEVGTQVSGVIEKIYVDYNSTVKKGQLLAELDKTTLKASLDVSTISLKSAQIELAYLKQKYDRISKLFEKSMVSQEEIDQAKYDFERAKTSVEKADAEVKKAKLNLSYATIYSPIDGTVLTRSVDEGQTVAASLNAPTLFTIARDLLKMEVYASVDEADIGQVKNGQRVTFTVDAFPNDTFNGSVSQVRLEPVVTSNVVTYTVTILAENPNLKLMPGMTATITVFLKEVSNVLTIPNKALRFKPDQQMLEGLNAPKPDGSRPPPPPQSSNGGDTDFVKRDNARPDRNMQMPKEGHDQKNSSMVWIKKGDKIIPARIKTGLSDAINVEVSHGLKEGDEVIIGTQTSVNKKSSSEKSGEVNPFMPQRPQSQRKGRMR